MPETATISSLTESLATGTSIAITTPHIDINALPDTLLVNVTETVGSQDNEPFIEGECMIRTKNSPDNISWSINDQGHLILTCSTGDESRYSIDNNGHLIYLNMSAVTTDLGFVQAVISALTPPSNIKQIWYDENVNKHKVYNTNSGTWIALY